jgi:hypothetical protein
MNEMLIKNLIKYKLNIVESIIDTLPEKMSEDAKNLGKIILEGVNESFQEIKEQPVKKPKSEVKLENITID